MLAGRSTAKYAGEEGYMMREEWKEEWKEELT